MSEQPPSNPYGASPDPYGQPPSNPYGQAGQPGQQQPYGYGTGAPYGAAPVSDKRPGTVTAAAVITILLALIAAAGLVLGLIGTAAARQDVVDEINSTSGMEDLDADQLIGVIVVVLAVLLVWAIASIVLAALVLRRSNAARIALVVSSVVTALASLVAVLSVVSLLWLLGAVVVIILLFTGGAGDWFARRAGAGAPPPNALS